MSLLWLGFYKEHCKGSVQGLASGCINRSTAGIANHPSTPPVFTRKVDFVFISNVSFLLPKNREKSGICFMFLSVFLLTIFEHQGCFHELCHVCLYYVKHRKFLLSVEKAVQICLCSCKLVPTLENSFVGLRVQSFFSKM